VGQAEDFSFMGAFLCEESLNRAVYNVLVCL